MLEARNLRNLTMAQTPLLGDENTPLHVKPTGGTGFDGATPRHAVAFTPNPLATPRGPVNGSALSQSAGKIGVGGTPFRTPMRDNLNINAVDGFDATPRDVRRARESLKSSFMALPRPENNFELAPEDEDDSEAPLDQDLSVEDAAERDARLKHMRFSVSLVSNDHQ